ncbi:MAG TPA: PAS domain-containing protein [Spirochaetota bacterium]|nr:PAS domain-containing protein [Spirochaetota bacterium]HPJ33687.1 PAS domain-containing protein [Spirochaetota bacterium]
MNLIFYREVIENLFDGVYFVDIDGRVIFRNRVAERINSCSEEQVKGSLCSDTISVPFWKVCCSTLRSCRVSV